MMVNGTMDVQSPSTNDYSESQEMDTFNKIPDAEMITSIVNELRFRVSGKN